MTPPTQFGEWSLQLSESIPLLTSPNSRHFFPIILWGGVAIGGTLGGGLVKALVRNRWKYVARLNSSNALSLGRLCLVSCTLHMPLHGAAYWDAETKKNASVQSVQNAFEALRGLRGEANLIRINTLPAAQAGSEQPPSEVAGLKDSHIDSQDSILESITYRMCHMFLQPSTEAHVTALLRPDLEAAGVCPHDIDACITHLTKAVHVAWADVVTVAAASTGVGSYLFGAWSTRIGHPRVWPRRLMWASYGVAFITGIFRNYPEQSFPHRIHDKERVAMVIRKRFNVD